MNIPPSSFLSLLFIFAAIKADAKEPIRIDGTTDELFKVSFEKMVRLLKTSERRTFSLGLFGALLKHECLSDDAIVRLTFMPVDPRDAPLLSSCRTQLNGMSYAEILQHSEPPAKESVQDLPN